MKSIARPKIIAKLLRGGRHSKYDMATYVPCTEHTAQRLLKALHDEGLVYIAGWAPIYRTRIPEYAWGKGRDVPKPHPISDAKRKRELRKNDPEYRLNELMKKRAKRARERKAVADWWEERKS